MSHVTIGFREGDLTGLFAACAGLLDIHAPN